MPKGRIEAALSLLPGSPEVRHSYYVAHAGYSRHSDNSLPWRGIILPEEKGDTMAGEVISDMIRDEAAGLREREGAERDTPEYEVEARHRDEQQSEHERIVESTVDPLDADGQRRRAEKQIEQSGWSPTEDAGRPLSAAELERETEPASAETEAGRRG